jgi:hypothetical protein
MGQFSAEKPVAPGSVLSGNQQRISFDFGRRAPRCTKPASGAGSLIRKDSGVETHLVDSPTLATVTITDAIHNVRLR